jgi:hypothetical protein
MIEAEHRLFITSCQFDRLLATLPREVQGFRLPTWGAADDDPPPCFQQTQAVADIAFGSGERAHQLGGGYSRSSRVCAAHPSRARTGSVSGGMRDVGRSWLVSSVRVVRVEWIIRHRPCHRLAELRQ